MTESNSKRFRISTSEANALGCEAKWFYGFHPSMKLQSRTLNPNIERGTLGHSILEEFFDNIFDGVSYDRARETAMKLHKKMKFEFTFSDEENDDLRIPLMEDLEWMLPVWFDRNKSVVSEFRVLGTELEMEMPIGNEEALGYSIDFIGKVDLLVEYTKGRRKGEIAPWDHKFKYNFFTESALDMNAQIPGYIALSRYTYPGARIRRGVFNQIRYRKVKDLDERIKLLEHPVSEDEIRGILENHRKLAAKAVYYRQLSGEKMRSIMTRTIGEMTCKSCSFRLLCKADMMGQDTTSIVQHEYEPRTYGYDNVDNDGEN